MKRIPIILIVTALLVGCSNKLSINLLPSETLNLSTPMHGAEKSTCLIAPGTLQHKELENWLSENRGGWQSTPASYVPGTVVSGSNFSLNFVGSIAIVNYSGGQYSHPAKPADYEFLKCK